MMMILYHFPTSPYARRVRLALAHKGLTAELRDARKQPEHMREVERLHPCRTVPVLIDDPRVIVDSTAILHYLDRKHPEPPLWPAGEVGAEVFEYLALANSAIDVLIDLGLRYQALHDHPQFPAVRIQQIGRTQRALEAIAARVSACNPAAPLCGDRWSAADMAIFTLVVWLETMPLRAATFPPAGKMLALGWTLPATLSTWADPHRQRDDVRALD
ncbi:MAG TPA: glutathione S-transferase family protein [Polyangiales bacterium]|nr:glutathione S-transferase family protein [Polyangiales bacterium]